MTTIGTRNLTLADLAKRKDPDGKIAPIVEILNHDHQTLEYATFLECNDGTNHKTTVRTGLPSGTWRQIYGGIQSTKSSTQQVMDGTGMLEALPKIDVDLVKKSTDPKAALLSEHTPHMEGLKQDVEATLFYGDTSIHPERFTGLHPRYNAYCRATPDNTKSDYNVIHGGGAGSDNTSIWLITWGDNACSFLYPKGSTAGLNYNQLGEQLTTAYDGSGNPAGDYLAYVSHYKWDVGLTVRDWRAVGRICNIDMSNLEADSGAADLIDLMIRLSERVKGSGKKMWVMHERVRTMLRLQMRSDSNVHLTFDSVEGRKVMHFDEVPVVVSDQLLLTESALPQAS